MGSVFIIQAVLLFLVGCGVGFPQEHEVSKDKIKEAAMIVVNDCRDQEGATDEDVKALQEHKLPSTEKGLCLLRCLFNTVKVMKSGKFYKQGTLDFIAPALKDDETKTKKVKQMLDTCEAEIINENPCLVAKEIAECTHKYGKEFGFAFPNKIKN